METNTLLLIGAGIVGGLLALLLMLKIIKGILQIAYLLLVLGASIFAAYYLGTPQGSALLPSTLNIDLRLIQAGVIIVLPLLLSVVIGIVLLMLRQVFKTKPRRLQIDTNPTPVTPFHPPTPEELQRARRTQSVQGQWQQEVLSPPQPPSGTQQKERR
jgi:hypothetical protein